MTIGRDDGTIIHLRESEAVFFLGHAIQINVYGDRNVYPNRVEKGSGEKRFKRRSIDSDLAAR